jgi:hypothetical protein
MEFRALGRRESYGQSQTSRRPRTKLNHPGVNACMSEELSRQGGSVDGVPRASRACSGASKSICIIHRSDRAYLGFLDQFQFGAAFVEQEVKPCVPIAAPISLNLAHFWFERCRCNHRLSDTRYVCSTLFRNHILFCLSLKQMSLPNAPCSAHDPGIFLST